MLKGCQKEMYVLETRESPLFERAYLILRPQKTASLPSDMVVEANRIIGHKNVLQPPSKRATGRFSTFCWGFLCGALGAVIIMLPPLLF